MFFPLIVCGTVIIVVLMLAWYLLKAIVAGIIWLICRKKPFDIFPKSKQINGYDYEERVAKSLWKKGYRNVIVTSKSGDYGADIVATNKHGEKICFQCKHYNGVVGIDSVQEIAAAKKYYGCSRGAVVTNSKFTKAAKELALSNDIDLFEEYEALFYD